MRKSGIKLFIVAGRTGPSLIVSKALPFSFLEEIEEIVIFSEKEGFKIPKCRYISNPGWLITLRPSSINKLLRLIYEPVQLLYYTILLKPDIINGIYCLPKGLNSLIVSKLTHTKCLVSVIGSQLEVETELPLRRLWENINVCLLKRCDAITIKGKVDSAFLFSKNVDPKKMFTLNGAIDTEKFSLATGNRPIDLLFVGTFYELKGPDRFLQIIHKLKSIFPKIKAVMLGDGIMLSGIKKMATDLDLRESIIFEGYQKSTVSYFQMSKIIVLPSRSESLPTSMLEAMSSGCVPVISDVGNVREAAENNVNSKIVSDYRDIDGFVNCIKDLLADQLMLNEFAIKARKKVEYYYSIEKQSVNAKSIIDFLELK